MFVRFFIGFLILTQFYNFDNCEMECPDYFEDFEYDVLYPHETYCELFYKCAHGVPMLQQCPTGLHWNAVENNCDWIWRANCQLSTSTTSSTTSSTTTTTTSPVTTTPPIPPLTTTTSTTTTPTPTKTPPPTTTQFCSHIDDPFKPILIAHSKLCEFFYKCSNGKPYPCQCPENLHWNDEKKYCDYQYLANCPHKDIDFDYVYTPLVNVGSCTLDED